MKIKCEMGTTCRRVGVRPAKVKQLVLLAATAFVLAAPGFAHATTVGAATYFNEVTAYNSDIVNYNASSTTNSTGGIGIQGVPPDTPTGTTYTVGTSNNYAIPQLSVSMRTVGQAGANAESKLTYFIEFAGPSGGTTSLSVSAFAEASSPGGAGVLSGDSGDATAAMTISNSFGQVANVSAFSERPNGGLFETTFNQTVTFQDNSVYTVFMDVTASADAYQDPTGQSISSALVDPYFDLSNLPNGVTFLESDGIGNSLPNVSATPLPATLPLFAGGLGFVGYLTRRKKNATSPALPRTSW
jgi:hypothetical protein